jgi:hypothetical protein
MKKIIFIISILSVVFTACKDDNNAGTLPTPVENYSGIKYNQQGNLNILLTHTFNGAPLVLGKDYITPLQDTINLSKFKYYLSNVCLQNVSGNWVNLGNYNLLDLVVPDRHTIKLNNVPAGNYVKIKFFLGVDSLENFGGMHTGELDPSYGMYWTWATGYVFFRLNGRYNGDNPFTLDLGGNKNLPTIELDLSQWKVSGNSINLQATFNLADIFVSPHNYKLNSSTDDMHSQSYPAASILRDNLQVGCFTITSIN